MYIFVISYSLLSVKVNKYQSRYTSRAPFEEVGVWESVTWDFDGYQLTVLHVIIWWLMTISCDEHDNIYLKRRLFEIITVFSSVIEKIKYSNITQYSYYNNSRNDVLIIQNKSTVHYHCLMKAKYFAVHTLWSVMFSIAVLAVGLVVMFCLHSRG